MENKKLEVPQGSISDVAHTGVSVVLSAVPILGLGELFKATITPPLERRRDQWMQAVGEAIEQLQKKQGIPMETLRDNEEFISLLTEASRAAISTHLEEKRKALKNTLINSLSPDATYDRSSLYIRTIDRLVPFQMQILEYIDSLPSIEPIAPENSAQDIFIKNVLVLANGPQMEPLIVSLPELQVYLADLVQIGLISHDDTVFNLDVPSRSPYYKLSAFGQYFMAFTQTTA